MITESCKTLIGVAQKHAALPPDISDCQDDEDSFLGLPHYHTSLVENIAQEGGALVPMLSAHLEALQESLMDFLKAELAASGVTLGGRVHMFLSPDERLVVEGEDNEAEILCDIITANPVFKRCFQNISRLAMLTAGMETVCKAYDAPREKDSGNPLLGRYHLCFKGALSHFFIK